MKIKAFIFFIIILFGINNSLFAHITLVGGNSSGNGFLHPFYCPAQILTVISLGILICQQSPAYLKFVIFSFLISLTIGMLITTLGVISDLTLPLLMLAICQGLFIVINPRFSLQVYIIFACLTGLFLGLDSEQQALTGKEKAAALIGTWISLWACFAFVIILSENMNKKEWQKITLRILGSWITTISLLVFFLSIYTKK